MNRPLIAAALAPLWLLACNAAPADSGDTNASRSAATPPADPARAYADEGKDELMSWSLTYPAEIAAIPQLADAIRADFARTKAENLASAAQQKAEMAKGGYDFPGYEQSDTFEIAGASDALLSIEGSWYMFTGGAHPNHGQSAILWDRSAKRKIAPEDLVEGGAAAFAKYFRDPYCAALNADRKSRRGGVDLVDDPKDPFNQCPPFAELSIIPTASKPGQKMTRLVFHADPYVAGPYVEGDYDVVLPVTAGFLAALKPAYRSSFAAN